MKPSSWQKRKIQNHTSNTSSFPSIFRESQSSQPIISHKYPSFNANRANIHRSRSANTAPITNTPNEPSVIQWLQEWFLETIFNSYPIWIQSIITAIIGFISYFLYDYAVGLQSIHSYLLYKIMSFIGFLISVFLLYIVSINIIKPKKTLFPSNTASASMNNPYTSSLSSNLHRIPPQKQEFKKPKRDDLYFTSKSLLNRVSSQVLNTNENQTKIDYNSSPQKIESLDPTQVATQQNLHKFLKQQQNAKLTDDHNALHRAPSSVLTTPIGKTFGSMRMTPHTWSTPNKSMNKTNQGSAGIYTPNSSMDVTMISYDHTDEPFNVDFSVIQANQTHNMMQKSGTAWNISGFGGNSINRMQNAMHLGDVSMMAQPGTPAKGGEGYDYGGMYADINLRGDNIGQNIRDIQQESVKQNKKVMNVMRGAPMSPFSRKQTETTNVKDAAMSNIVFTSMGVKKSHFAAFYMEKSIDLYCRLKIDGLIENWAESMRWWLSVMVKTRNNQVLSNDNDINKILNLLSQKYNLSQQLAGFRTSAQKELFVLQNENQLINVAKQENNPSIMHIIQKRKHLKECMDLICSKYVAIEPNVFEYIYHRISQLSSTNNLTLYNWNGGEDSVKWRQGVFPNDGELVMALFCRYMDDAMCPAIKFSEKHYIEISIGDIGKTHKLYKKFKDIAIICVSDANAKRNKEVDEYKDIMDHDSLPYFFIAFNKQKFDEKIKHYGAPKAEIRKPKHFLYENKDEKEQEQSENDDYYHVPLNANKKYKHKKGHKDSVGTWFPQPGKHNLIHTITLFAVFIHRYCNDKLADIGLKDQGCTLLDPVLK